MHQTDYFIWSIKCFGTQGNKIGNADYSSPNFVAQAAEQDAKVSPYLAPSPKCTQDLGHGTAGVSQHLLGPYSEGQNIYLNARASPWPKRISTPRSKQLLADYKPIQYDITTGKNYLKDTSFHGFVVE